MPTLKASRQGLAKIKQARNEKGWGWSMEEDDTCLVEASKVLEPGKNWLPGGPYAIGISEPTWKRFLAGKQSINAAAFKAYCQVLGLSWEEVVDRASPAIANTHQDWGEEIDICAFYGRASELAQLEQCIVTERCRLVALLGMGGIGKTALGVKLAQQIQHSFDSLIWRSLRNAPPVQDILADWIEFLSYGQQTDLPGTIDEQISRLIEYLRAKRCLLLLDDLETILRSGELAGQYREGYQDYGKLIKRVAQERHQSCLVVIGREKLKEIAALAGATLPVRELKLRGLPNQDAKKILEAKGFSSLPPGWEDFILRYRGNPLALNIMANTIQEIFNGDISQFLEQTTFFIGDILTNILNQQFERLSEIEKGIVYCLALENQPISLADLKADMRFFVSSSAELIAALESLKRRSFLEEDKGTKAFFTIQPAIGKYVTDRLIERVCQDIIELIATRSLDSLGLLKTLSLVKEQEPDDIKDFQIRLIPTRVIEKLHMTLKGEKSLKEQLNAVLLLLKGKPPPTIGYAHTNLLNILSLIEN
jgi:hypothetical protein